jgi:hypothetical protein
MIEILKKEGLFLSNGYFNPSYQKKFFNTITPERSEWYTSLSGELFSEKIYLLENNIQSIPVCKICSNSVKFISYREGYREYCSLKCKSIGCKETIKKTNIERYGFIAPAQNKEIQNKMKKTCKENHGVENYFQLTDKIKQHNIDKYGVACPSTLDSVKDKAKKTNMERYGVEFAQQNEDIKKKRSNTNKKKYGNICSAQGKEIQEVISQKKKETYFNKVIGSEKFTNIVIPLFSLEEYKKNIDISGSIIYYPWQCKVCNTKFEDYVANGNIPRCPTCYPPSVQGKEEKELLAWIKEILPDTEIIQNTRRLIKPLEIDIYLPEYKLAIEMNELYWHSELTTKGVRDSQYHLNKLSSCKELGISLIHIFDFEWINKKQIIKSILKSKLGLYDVKLGARKCSIKSVSTADSKIFLNSNHIQGYAPASIRLGLYYDNELVSLLAIAKNRFKKGTYEIVRYASKLNYSVQGGLSKLWKEASTLIEKPFTLISYVDQRFFEGNSNLSLGLEYLYSNRPAYYYTKDYKIILNRMLFQKKNLKKKLTSYNSELTEWENMKLNGYDRVWDCGTKVFSKSFE